MTDPAPTKPRRRRRRLVVIAAIALALAVVGWFLLDANRYKGSLEAYLLERTGLAIDLGTIEWGVSPTLHATVDRATVTAPNWEATLQNVSVQGSLTALAQRRLVLTELRAASVNLTLPDSPRDWLDVYRDIADGLRPRELDRPRRIEVETVGPIVVERAEVRSNDVPDVLLVARVSISDVMAKEIRVAVEGVSPAGGPSSMAGAEAVLERLRGEGLQSITVTGGIEGVNLHGLVPEFPPALLQARFNTTSSNPKRMGVEIEGDLNDPAHPVLNGDLSAMFWYTPEFVNVNDIRYEAPGARLRADFTRHRSREIAVEVSEATLDGEALDAFLEQARSESVYLTAAAGAHVSAENVLFGMRADGEQEFIQGTLDFSGLAVRDRDGHAYETNISGRGHMKGRQITVEQIEGDHSRFSGTLEPDIENAAIAYAATGRVRLTDEVLPPRISDRYLPSADLPVRITELHGSFTRGERPGPTLEFEAEVEPGTARLTVADVDAEVAVAGGTLHFDEGVLNIQLDAEAPEFGMVQARGEYEIHGRRVTGVIECDVPQVLPNFVPGLEPGSMYTSILEQFGRTEVAVATTIPRSSYDTVVVDIRHEAEPPLDGSIAFARAREGGLRLGDLRIEGILAAGPLDERMKGPFVVTGPVDVEFTRDAGSESFAVAVDGTPASVRFGQRIEKQPGDPLLVAVQGEAPRAGWRADRLVVTTFGQRIPIAFVEDGLLLQPTPLNLTAMSRLAPEGGFLEGGAVLGFDTRTDSFLFGFEDASFSLGNGLGLEVLDGEVRIDSGRVGESVLRMRNPAGEATASWTRAGEDWRGTVRGEYLDVDLLVGIVDAIGQASVRESAPPDLAASGEPAEFPLEGALDIELERVKYQYALFTEVTGAGSVAPGAIRLPFIRANAYGGTIEGNAELLAGEPRMLHTAFTFDRVDTALLDDIYFESERGFNGAATGELWFSAPLGPVADMLAAGNGGAELVAVDGTFGEAGWATRLLAVLKTVEIFALRAPWREEGLSYDTLDVNFTMVDGRAELHDTHLVTAAYKMDAAGYMDFAENETDIQVDVNLLQAINRIARHIPVIRNIADLTTERIAVRINVTGPPSDLRFSVPPDAGIFQNIVGIGENGSN